MSADVIWFISPPRHASEQTDFPTITFRSVVHDFATGQAEPARKEYCEPDNMRDVNVKSKSNYRNTLSGSQPDENCDQCPCRNHAMQGRDGRGTRFGGQRNP